HRLGTVAGGRDPGVLEVGQVRLFLLLGGSGDIAYRSSAHAYPRVGWKSELGRSLFLGDLIMRAGCVVAPISDDDAPPTSCQGRIVSTGRESAVFLLTILGKFSAARDD